VHAPVVGQCDAQAAADKVGSEEQEDHGPREREGGRQRQQVHAAQEGGILVVSDIPLPLEEVALVHTVQVREGHPLGARLLLLQVELWLGQHLRGRDRGVGEGVHECSLSVPLMQAAVPSSPWIGEALCVCVCVCALRRG